MHCTVTINRAVYSESCQMNASSLGERNQNIAFVPHLGTLPSKEICFAFLSSERVMIHVMICARQGPLLESFLEHSTPKLKSMYMLKENEMMS